MKVLVAQLCLALCNPTDCSPQAPLCTEFSRKEYWSGLPFSSPGESSQPRDRTEVSCTAGRYYYLSHQESPTIEYIFTQT